MARWGANGAHYGGPLRGEEGVFSRVIELEKGWQVMELCPLLPPLKISAL